jgi:cob(I)alamin adenosyltransferase
MKYVYYKNAITAITSFGGKIIKGTAKCDPGDTYVKELGELIAKSRCDVKVARHRTRHAEKKLLAAKRELQRAKNYAAKMENYLYDAMALEMQAKETYENLMEHI